MNVGFASDLGIDFKKIMSFYQDYWSRKIAISDNNFHQWQFQQPPANKGINSCVTAEKDGRILGVMGLNKRNFYLSGKVKNGAELTTWVVDPSTKGVGIKILNFITRNFDYLIGMGISEEALPIYLFSNFRYLRHIPRFIYPINAEKVLEISEYTSIRHAKLLVKPAKSFNTDIDHERIVWSEMKEPPFIEGNYFSRSIEDLVWRYDNHPYYKYLNFKIFCKESLIGYVVLRGEITDNIKLLHVVDILGKKESYEYSIKFIESYAKKYGYWAVDIFSTFAPLNKYFNMRGWLSSVDSSFINIPHLFHPLEIRNPSTTSLIYWSKNRELESYDVNDLYLTKQDADLDRPTMEYIKKIR